MGRVKEELMQSQERGWDAPDTYVCRDCVEDEYLKSIIDSSLSCPKCSYCRKKRTINIAAPIASILPAISAAIHYYYNDPGSAGVPYEKGYVFEPKDTTEDVLESLPLQCHEDLFTDIANSFDNTLWTETAEGYWAGSHLSDIMDSAWKRFSHIVKHELRYFFTFMPEEETYSEELSPVQLLKAIGKMAANLNLITTLPVNTDLFRVRYRDSTATWLLNWEQLGPPPNEKAKAGRMNPAGISYFYLAVDQKTAIAEVVSKPPCSIAFSRFKTLQDLLILDLCQLPAIPSIFDINGHAHREWIYFLYSFVREISEPTLKNGQEHIDYVPSQIVSEFFAKEFRTEDGKIINGIKYPSTVRPGGINIVLFPPPKGHKAFQELAELDSHQIMTFNNWTDFLSAIS